MADEIVNAVVASVRCAPLKTLGVLTQQSGAEVWVDASDGHVPPGAVVGGQDCSGETIYVARAMHEGAMLPGKLVSSHRGACVPWGGREFHKPQYQVLVGNFNNWVPTIGANILTGAVHGGETEDDEPLYIGRVQHSGSITTGKVQQSLGLCYIPFGGQEINFTKYEVLVAPPEYHLHPGGGVGVWVDASGGQVLPGAVVGGQDCSGEPIYIARAQHEGALLPGKLVSSHGCTYVPWGGRENAKPQYQILVGGPNNWVPTNGANVPAEAFPGGKSESGEPLFIGRVRHKGSVTTGKVQQSHGLCYISFAGQELGFPDYEILIS